MNKEIRNLEADSIEEKDYDIMKYYPVSDISTKEQLLSALNYSIESNLEYAKAANAPETRSENYFNGLVNIYKNLRAKVEKMPFMRKLDKHWSYLVEDDDFGARVYLVHKVESMYDGEYCIYYDAKALYAEEKARLLTVEEYAKLYGVQVVTVRQWIRRGKLRTALKAGSDWRIPELTEAGGRGYIPGGYNWETPPAELVKDYPFAKDCTAVNFDQDEEDKNIFIISFLNNGECIREVRLNKEEREKLELSLISNPLVEGVTFYGL